MSKKRRGSGDGTGIGAPPNPRRRRWLVAHRSDDKVVVMKSRVKAMQRLDIGTLGLSFFPSRNPPFFSVFGEFRRAQDRFRKEEHAQVARGQHPQPSAACNSADGPQDGRCSWLVD